ncbi:hypothetical protein FACS1894104_0780 [Actinomycetota bacterium]|nr:hypothetical protein FACS1894104_0780 [Actinomycetota bacterium]
MFELSYFLRRSATMFPERLALVFDDKELTYKELNEMANMLANGLISRGIKKGDVVGYMFCNSIETVVCFHAITKLGAVALPINTLIYSEELTYTLNKADAKVLIYHEEFDDKIQEAKSRFDREFIWIRKGLEPDKTISEYDDILASGSSDEVVVDLDWFDPCYTMFTSGTTGKPKAVQKTSLMVRDYALQMTACNENIYSPEVILTHCPLFHLGGFRNIIKAVAISATLVVLSNMCPQRILEMIERYHVTQTYFIPPILYLRLRQVENWQKYDLSSVRQAQSSGGKMTLDYAQAIFELFPNCLINVAYGSTETACPIGCLLDRDEIKQNPERFQSIGLVHPLYEARILDAKGNEITETDEVGELVVKSTTIADKYLNDEELSKTSFVDGWFYTEDMVRRSKDGFFYLTDRKRDMVKTGGENVYAQEVEGVLLDYPTVEDCAVIGVPDERFGEGIAAAVVLKSGYSLDTDDLIRYCKQNMPSFKKPRYITVMDELPRNSVNKIQKQILRDKHEGLFKRIP